MKISFDNWIIDPDNLKREYETEYPLRQAKLDLSFSYLEFLNLVKNAKVIHLSSEERSQIVSKMMPSSIDELKEQSNRDVESIVSGFQSNSPMPYPLLIEVGGRLSLFGGLN